MSGINYTISGNYLLDITGVIDRTVVPAMHQAVKVAAQTTEAKWKESVYRAKLWSGEKDAYANSITWDWTGEFSAYVSASYKHAGEIETGRPPYDLKKMLDTSNKVRRTKDGRRFLVIPMRHGTPGNSALSPSMPSAIHSMAEAMSPSKITSIGKRQSGEVTNLSPTIGMHAAAKQSPFLSNPKTKQAAMVVKRNYAWGGRLTAGMLNGAGMSPADVKKYAGMVKMDASTKSSRSSSYTTFRVMIEGSTGWIIPAKPGLYLARNVAQTMQPITLKLFQAAVEKTMAG